MARKTEAAFAATLVVLGSALALATPYLIVGRSAALPYHARASFFPWAALCLVIVFGSWSTWQAWRGTARDLSDEIDASDTSVVKALGGAVLLALYVVLCMAIGYAASTAAVLVLLCRWAGVQARQAFVIAGGATAVLWAIFPFGFKIWFAPAWVQGWLP